jgi:quercetin 2,3-dioxygenase
MYASILEPSRSVSHTFSSGVKKGYVHLIQTSGYVAPRRYVKGDGSRLKVKSGDVEVEVMEGDGVYIDGVGTGSGLELESVGGRNAEFVFFELE